MIIDYVKKHSQAPRMERKYYIPTHHNYLLKQYIKLSRGGLKEIYHERKINNIYYDTDSLSFYKDNLIGAKDRVKLRLRWYGEKKMISPNLEIKMKEANLVYKLITPFNNQLKLPIKELIKKLRPSVSNSYYRRYYLTQNKKVRLTIDTKISFNKAMSPKTVVELKYDPDNEMIASRLIQSFPLSLQKNSKYVQGIANSFF